MVEGGMEGVEGGVEGVEGGRERQRGERRLRELLLPLPRVGRRDKLAPPLDVRVELPQHIERRRLQGVTRAEGACSGLYWAVAPPPPAGGAPPAWRSSRRRLISADLG